MFYSIQNLIKVKKIYFGRIYFLNFDQTFLKIFHSKNLLANFYLNNPVKILFHKVSGKTAIKNRLNKHFKLVLLIN